MPPEGRRKKKFEQEMRRVQNRNFFAALVLIIAAVASVFLIRWIMLSQKPEIFVSINRVDHSGTREIPFSKESCDVLTQSFQDYLVCTTGEVQELDEENSKLKLDPKTTNRDVLVVYLNGHLVGKPEDNGTEVYWIGPESERLRERKLSELLTSADASPAKIKIVLLDAGRYTWSPGFPGREPNQFQTALINKLTTNEWGLGGNLWVITSHSDNEISNVSTPMECSLFAKAVAESLKSLSTDASDEIPVPQLFDEIRKRTQSYSRNFNNKSLQNPVLIKAGFGVVSSDSNLNDQTEIEPMRVSWIEQDEPEESEPAPKPPVNKYPLSDFAQDPDKYSQRLYQSNSYAALPNQTIRSLERFMEFGEDSADLATTDQEKLRSYSQQLAQTTRPAPGRPTNFDSEILKKKQDKIKAFRKALLEFSVLIRFREQMRFWDDNAYDAVPPLPPALAEPIRLPDKDLKEAVNAPPTIDNWLNQWNDFKINNEKMVERVDLQLRSSGPYSPLQAELLGVLSQRYLTLIPPTPTADETEATKSRTGELEITLEINVKGRFNPGSQPTDSDLGAGFKDVVQKSIAEVEKLRNAYANLDSDTSLRYRLAAAGSEFADAIPGAIPNVAWQPIKPRIDIRAISPVDVHKVYPYDMIPIQLVIETSAVDDINLEIAASPDDKLEGLNFGFTPEFKPSDIVSDLDSTDDAHRKRKTVDVYFQYPQVVQANVGRPFAFSITATDRNNFAEPETFDFKIEITDEATYWVMSRRVLANKNDDERTKLFHWGTSPSEKEWEPLVIRTLANIKSDFEISLQNNSNVQRSFIVKLFKIRDFPNEIDRDLLRADREDWEQVSNFAQWLKRQNLEPNDAFELIGQASVDQINPQDTKPIRFTLPQPSDPKEKKLDPETRVLVEFEQGALVVFYATDKPEEPAWYQMLQFQPRDSANVAAANNDRLKVKTEIEDVFGNDIFKIKDRLAPLLADSPAARLSIVSQTALNENKDLTQFLKLDELLAEGGGARFSPGREPALLMLDVLGVSNYATYEINGTTLERTPLRKHLSGIRITNAPEGWDYNPKSWSFAPTTQLAPPFEWLASSDSNGVTDCFIHIKDNPEKPAAVKKELILEVFLPFQNDDTLSWATDDFWWRWKFFKRKLFFPNSRRHFVEISGTGMTAWSEITSHRITVSDPADKVLEIGQGNTTLGQWRFVSKSLNILPTIDANRKKVWNSIPDIKTVVIDVDVRDIKPTISPSQITLKLNGTPVKEIAEFLSKHQKGLGRYQFSLYDIVSEFDDLLKKEKMDVEIEVIATDFFGKSTARSAMVTVAPKPVVKPPPKPVTLVVNLVLDEKPADIFRFGEVIIDKKSIPLNRLTSFKGGQVKIIGNIDASTLTIEGLIPGSYDLTVNALVKPTGEAIYTRGSASKSKIKVAEGEPPATLEFK